jgi:hypothetical protein
MRKEEEEEEKDEETEEKEEEKKEKEENEEGEKEEKVRDEKEEKRNNVYFFGDLDEISFLWGQENIGNSEIMKNAVFWDVTPCGSCKTEDVEKSIASIISVTRICELRTLAIFLRSVRRFLERLLRFSSSILVTLMMEGLCLSET